MAITRPLLSMITNWTDTQHGYPTPAPSPQQQQGEVTCWILDTRGLWPGDDITTALGAAEAMSLITLAEQKAIRGKMFMADARMSLGSALIKRAFISRTLGIPWKDVRIGKKDNQKHGKPCAVDFAGRPVGGIDFNVSHQGGLVALIGYSSNANTCSTPSAMVYGIISPTTKTEVAVGVDIVCVNERDDYRTIDQEGFDGWVDMYDEVFSAEERWSMKYDVDSVTLLDGTKLQRDDIGRHDRCIARNQEVALTTPTGRKLSFNSEQILDSKLRRFYTYFCYKEAFVKLSGQGLLAPWIKQLEFFNVRSPAPGVPARCSDHGTWGEVVEDVEVHLHGRPISDVRMRVQAFEENFMLSSALQGEIQGLKIPSFRKLDLTRDILLSARLTKTSVPLHMRTGEDHMFAAYHLDKDLSPHMAQNPYRQSYEVPLCLL